MIHYSNCPVCKQGSIAPAFTAKDFTVSQEQFSIWKCSSCGLMFTQDVPDQDHIGRYYQSDNYISHSDTQEGLVNKIYHQVRNITLAAKCHLVSKKTGLRNGALLDIGCGTGAFLDRMQHAGWQVTGLEPDESARQKANTLYQLSPLPSPEIFSLPEGSYDAITMWHVLEHVHQLHEYVARCKLLLKEHGKIFIAVPNYTSGDALAYKEGWAAFDVPRHLYHFSPASMKKLMQMHGLLVLETKPMWYDSFYVSMLSEQYKNGKGNIFKAFTQGLMSNIGALTNSEKCSSIIYVIGKN